MRRSLPTLPQNYALTAAVEEAPVTHAVPPPATGDQPGLRYPKTGRRVRIIAEALFADETGCVSVPRLNWLVAAVDDFLEHAGPGRRGFQLAVSAVHWLAPIAAKRPTPLSRMSIAERIYALNCLEASALGGPLTGAKLLMCTIYYEHPEAAAEIGFSGGGIPEVA